MAACIKRAASRYGVISRQDALLLGLSPDAIQRLVRDKIWIRVLPGVYALWTPTSSEDRWRASLMAGSIWLGGASAISHRSAGVLWNLDAVPKGAKEFSTVVHRETKIAGLKVYRVRSLPPSHVTVRSGFRVTSLARTVVDLASVLTPRPFELAFESALRSGRASAAAIRRTLEQTNPKQQGRRLLRRLLDAYPGTPTGSALEADAWIHIRESGLPLPVRQYRIRNEEGIVVARPDFAYPELLLAIEVDGFVAHSKSRDLAHDRDRQNLMGLLGWKTYHITALKLEQDPAGIIREIAEYRAARAVALGL